MKKTALIVAGLLTTMSCIAASQDATEILNASGVQGGLVVVIGCNSPELLARLHAGGSYVVHGLDRDLEKVAAAREYLLEKKLYGSVTVSQWEGTHLPFVDGVVNLVVISSKLNVPRDEVLRVLAPNGVAVKLNSAT
ncbi:MAG: class I SAM-dependent methyltransferase [Planctomycetes bacterium]|nr:class I SAM-dependent methyltransferase [Planctomycetota bacterium]